MQIVCHLVDRDRFRRRFPQLFEGNGPSGWGDAVRCTVATTSLSRIDPVHVSRGHSHSEF